MTAEQQSPGKPGAYLAFNMTSCLVLLDRNLELPYWSKHHAPEKPYGGTLRLFGEGDWPAETQPSNHLCQTLACLELSD